MRRRAVLLVAVLVAGWRSAPAAVETPPPPPPPPSGAVAPAAEEVYSNIQVLRGVPAEQVLPAMELIAASLGVACEHCHVADDFEADDKPAKETAREMVRMMRAINRERFEGRRAVTCWSCHRGAPRPALEPLPAPDEGAAAPVGSRPAELEEAPEVAAAEVVARHVEAAGGSDAAEAIVARVGRGTATLFGGRELPVEIRQRRPLWQSTALEIPGGAAQVSTLDGATGTVEVPGRPPRSMSAAEIATAALAVDFHWLARPAEALSGLRVSGRRRTGAGGERIVVEATVAGRPVELAFDQGSGLLRRVTAWAETPVGRLLTEVEIEDYREVDGLKTPAVWTVARPEGRFTVRLDEIDHELAPAAPAAP